MSQWLTNLTRIHEDVGLVPGLGSVGQGSSIAVSCGVGNRHGSDLTLLQLWLGPAAVALIQPLAWEPPYAAGADLKSKNKNALIQKYALNFKYTQLLEN